MTPKPYTGPERRVNFFDQGYTIVRGPDMTPQIRMKIEAILLEAIDQGGRAFNKHDKEAMLVVINEATNRIEQAFLGIGRHALKDIETAIEGRK